MIISRLSRWLIVALPSLSDIIHISHGIQGVIPEYQPQDGIKALAR